MASFDEVVKDPDQLDKVLLAKLLDQVNKGNAKAAESASRIAERMAARKAGAEAVAGLRAMRKPLDICREVGRLGQSADVAEELLGRDLSVAERKAVSRGASDRVMEVRSAELASTLSGGPVQPWMTNK